MFIPEVGIERCVQSEDRERKIYIASWMLAKQCVLCQERLWH